MVEDSDNVYKYSPVYDLNEYLLDNTEIANLMDYDPAESANPFYPTNEEPESRPPFIRYTFRTMVNPDEWYIEDAEAAYAVIHPSELEGQHVVNIMKDLLKFGALSAYHINKWLKEEQANTGRTIDFVFHSVEYLGGNSSEPPGEEGGATAIFANFRIRYSPLRGREIIENNTIGGWS